MEPLLDFHEVEPPISTNVCASIDLERLVTLQDQGVGSFLIDLLNDQTKAGYRISTPLKDHSLSKNAVLDEAWASYTWAPNNWPEHLDSATATPETR